MESGKESTTMVRVFLFVEVLLGTPICLKTLLIKK